MSPPCEICKGVLWRRGHRMHRQAAANRDPADTDLDAGPYPFRIHWQEYVSRKLILEYSCTPYPLLSTVVTQPTLRGSGVAALGSLRLGLSDCNTGFGCPELGMEYYRATSVRASSAHRDRRSGVDGFIGAEWRAWRLKHCWSRYRQRSENSSG
jgi:hypothetical protein